MGKLLDKEHFQLSGTQSFFTHFFYVTTELCLCCCSREAISEWVWLHANQTSVYKTRLQISPWATLQLANLLLTVLEYQGSIYFKNKIIDNYKQMDI